MSTIQNERVEEGASPGPISKGSFGRDVFKLATGTAIAQVLGILLAPVLARLFSPHDYGILGIFVALYTTVGVIACGRYEATITMARDDDEAANLLAVSLIFASAISLLTVPIIWFGGSTISGWFSAPELQPYLWLIPLSIFSQGLFYAFNYWVVRRRRFANLSIASILNTMASLSTQLFTGLAQIGSSGLIIGNLFGSLASVLTLGSRTWALDRKFIFSAVKFPKIITGIKRYKKFPLIGVFSAFVNVLSQQLSVFLLSIYFSTDEVGFLNLSNRVLRVPGTFIGTAITQVFYQRAAKAFHDGKLPEQVKKIYSQMLMLWMFPLLLLILAGPDLFALIFGTQWRQAGVYSSVLSILTMVILIHAPIYSLINILEKLEGALINDLAMMGATIIAFVIGGNLHNSILALFLYALLNSLVSFGQALWLIRAAGVSLQWTFKSILKQIAICVPLLAIYAAAKWGLQLNAWGLLATCILTAVLYYAYILWKEPFIREEIFSLLEPVIGRFMPTLHRKQ